MRMRVGLVTGAARGIGHAIAERLSTIGVRDVAGLTSFLASSDATFINGAAIDLNGGHFTS